MKINWSKEHSKGFIIGVLTTFAACFLVVGILAWKNNYDYSGSLNRFFGSASYKAKVISLASIVNLIWFHFASLKKENWNFGMGVIAATFLSLILFLYFKFLA